MSEAAELGFIHRYVPPPSGTPSLTLLLLHGTGGSEDDLLSLGKTLAPHAALLSPRGRVSENGMSRFFRRLAPGIFDLDDLKRRTHELADFVIAAAEQYGFAADKVVAVGYSNGANIAASVMLLRPETLAGGILLRPMVPLEPDSLPDLHGVSVFIASGRLDPLVPRAQAERLAILLSDAGAEVTHRWHPGGHQLAREEIDEAARWLQHHFPHRDNAP